MFFYLLLILTVSCTASVLTVDMEGAVIQTFTSLVLGVLMALGVLIAPSIMYGRNVAEMNAVIALASGMLGKFILIGLIFCVIGIVIGWWLNEVSSEF